MLMKLLMKELMCSNKPFSLEILIMISWVCSVQVWQKLDARETLLSELTVTLTSLCMCEKWLLSYNRGRLLLYISRSNIQKMNHQVVVEIILK